MSTATQVRPGTDAPVLGGDVEGLDVTDLVGLPRDLDRIMDGVGGLGLQSVNALDRQRLFAALDQHEIEEFEGLFDKATDGYTFFEVRARFVDEICGGIPNDPEIIKAWLRSKTGIEDGEEIKRMMAKTLAETQGFDWENQPITDAVLDDMIARVEDQKHMCVFKRDPKGQIYIENRQLKACIRESTNILFATNKSAERFGPTKKAPKSFVAERFFIRDRRIYLCDLDPVTGDLIPRTKPSHIKTFTGHVSSPQGERSALTNYEVCHQPWFSFIIQVSNSPNKVEKGQEQPDDDINEARVLRILEQAELIGLGALRSQSSGMFKVLPLDQGGFTRLERPKALTTRDIAKKVPTVVRDF